MSAEPIRIARNPLEPAVETPPENALEAAAQQPEQFNESLAEKLRAKRAEIEAGTQQFPVPGWDEELVVEISPIKDRKTVAKGLTNEQLILAVTRRVLYRDDDGELHDIGGWEGVGQVMGLAGPNVSLGGIVREVLDNPLRLDGFAADLLLWMMGRRSVIDQVLGE